jgi:hypothetical protein
MHWLWIAIEPGFRSVVERRREAQSFRSEVDGVLPLRRHRSAVLGGDDKPHRNDVRERKMTLQLHNRTPSLLQDSTSLHYFRFNCGIRC